MYWNGNKFVIQTDFYWMMDSLFEEATGEE